MYGRIAEMTLRLEHRHNDGSWGTFERVAHDVAEHDPERSWAKGQAIYECTTCDEQIRVTTDEEPIEPPVGSGS
jgi:hypothetical protein